MEILAVSSVNQNQSRVIIINGKSNESVALRPSFRTSLRRHPISTGVFFLNSIIM